MPGEALSGTGTGNHRRTRRRHSQGGFSLDTEKTAGSPIRVIGVRYRFPFRGRGAVRGPPRNLPAFARNVGTPGRRQNANVPDPASGRSPRSLPKYGSQLRKQRLLGQARRRSDRPRWTRGEGTPGEGHRPRDNPKDSHREARSYRDTDESAGSPLQSSPSAKTTC